MKRYRRGNQIAFSIWMVVVALIACAGCKATAPAPTSTPVPTATAQPIQVPTATPQPTPVPTQTPVPTATSAPTPAPTPVSLEEAPCPFGAPDGMTAKCGYLTVPEDHFATEADGRTIRLAVAVLKDAQGSRRSDPLLFLCGGPGEKCVSSADVIAHRLAALRDGRDVVVFDQRGVGYSEPALECSEWEEAILDNLDEADPEAALRSTFAALMACRDRLLAEGHNLSAYNTIQNAADVQAIRQALGYEEINLFGGSYGSFLAQAVMRDYPDMVRSAIIDTVYPLEKSLFVDVPTNASEAILRLVDACAADEACDGAYPDLKNVLFEVVERLNADPVPIEVIDPATGKRHGAVLTGDGIVSNLTIFLYQTTVLPALPEAIYDVYEGDYGLMAQLNGAKLALLSAVSRGMMLSVVCAEDLVGRSPEDLKATLESVPPQLVGSADWELTRQYGIFGLCENWPVEEVDPAFKEPLVSDIPSLVLSGEYDPVTPAKWGRLVASYLSHATFFEFPGIGHSVNMASECARNITRSFLDDPSAAPQASCIDEMPGIVFDVPEKAVAAVELEPFDNEVMGVTGLLPKGWEEVAPRNFRRGATGLDQTMLALDVVPATADELFVGLSRQLGYDPEMAPADSVEHNGLTWSLYAFEIKGFAADLAIAEGTGKAYFVLLVTNPEERDDLRAQVFVPVVAALEPVG